MSGLWPKEHGAYAQLAFPLATGLACSGWHPGAAALAVVAAAAFFAHEPIALLTGLRGARLREALGSAARHRLVLLALVAAGGLLAASVLVPARAWLGALAPAGFGLLLLPSLGTRRMKTVSGELLAVGAFAATVVPLALSGDVPLAEAVVAAVAWLLAFAPAVFAVHAIKAALRRRPEELWLLRTAPPVAVLCLAGAVVGGWLVPDARELLAAAVPGAAILGFVLRPPHPRHLKRVGWSLVAANSVALALLLAL